MKAFSNEVLLSMHQQNGETSFEGGRGKGYLGLFLAANTKCISCSLFLLA
jgi:hypothetical protein